MILIINTAPSDLIQIILAQSADKFKIYQLTGSGKESERLLAAIIKFINKEKISLKNIKGIGVVTGPGRFTSVRIGVVVANSLAYGLRVPVVGIKADDFNDDKELAAKIRSRLKKQKRGSRSDQWVVPFYGKEPNITGVRN